MKMTYGLALAAALAFGCSSSSKSTRTAGNDTGTTQSASISGTQGTASSQQGTVSGTTAPPPASSGAVAQNQGSTSGSMDRSSGSMSGAVASSADNSDLRTVTGSVAKVDENSITLDQAAGGVTLTIDSQTQVIRRGMPAAGISSIREGEQVRTSFDPASNRAEKIEVMGKAKMHRQHKAVGSDQPAPAPGDATGK